VAAARGGLVACLLLGALGGASGAAAQEINRIGVLDVERVLAQSVAGRNARQDLERVRTQAQTDIANRRAAIEKLAEEIRRRGALLSADARRAKEAELERLTREAARAAEDLQRELERRNATLMQTTLREIDEIVTRFGREKGYYLIVEKRTHSVVYTAPAADVTDEIIRLYDQQVGQKPAAKPKSP
jgi:outer membrane protein